MCQITCVVILMMMLHLPLVRGEDGDRLTFGSPPHKSTMRSKITHPIKSPISFTTTHSYLVTKFKIYKTFNIKFMMKTIESNGLIMYSGYPSNDFMALEMYAGQLRYIFDVGSGPRLLQAAKKLKRRPDPFNLTQMAQVQVLVNDNAWHRIHLYRPSLEKHVLEVDGMTFVDYLPDSRSVFYDLPEGDLFLGGVPDELLTGQALSTQVNSRSGFKGCLACLTLDDKPWKLGENVTFVPEKFKDTITLECLSLPEECSEGTCLNGGKCIQRWQTTECDCNMTSFVGHRCNKSSLGYKFGPSGGSIIMKFDKGEIADSREDEIAFGLETTQETRAVLVRLTSSTSKDFITIEMDDGMICAIYNMGKVPHRVDSKSTIYSTNHRWQDFKVNDKRYHVVRLVRSSQNSSLSIDDNPALNKYPPGKQLSVFNELNTIQVGGSALLDEAPGPIISKPFHGAIYGLSVNGLRVLEMVANGDQRLATIGDAVEIKQNNHASFQQHQTSPTRQMTSESTTLSTTSFTQTTTTATIQTTTDIQTTTTIIIKNGRKTNQMEICGDKKERNRNSPASKLCRNRADDDDDDDDVTSSGMTSPTDDEDMIAGMDARPNYETIEPFHRTNRPSTLGDSLTRFKKVKVHTIHQWHDPAEEYIRNLNFSFANVRPRNSSHQHHNNNNNKTPHNSLLRTMTLNSGLLVGSVVTLTAVLLFLLTLLLLLKQRQKLSTKWKTLDDSLKSSTTQDSEKFHHHQQQQVHQQHLDEQSTAQTGNHTHLLNGSLHVHPTVKKVNSKEWYV